MKKMNIISGGLRVVGLSLVFVIMLTSFSYALHLHCNSDATITAAQQAVIDDKCAKWQTYLDTVCCCVDVTVDFTNADLGQIAAPVSGVELMLAYPPLPTGEWTTLAQASNFSENADGCPTYAKITFNNNPAVTWYWGVGLPVPAGSYDGWTVTNHELAHALGFTVFYTLFNAAVNPGPPRTVSACGVTYTLTPAAQGTHTDPTVHPNDLMNPALPTATRRAPTAILIQLFKCIFPRCPEQEPSLTQWGLIIMLIALVGIATWVVLKKRRVVAV